MDGIKISETVLYFIWLIMTHLWDPHGTVCAGLRNAELLVLYFCLMLLIAENKNTKSLKIFFQN